MSGPRSTYSMTFSFALHMVLHVALPLLVAALFYKEEFWKASLLMLAGILIDLDHLLAEPIMNPDRCSIGFHLLHQDWIIPIYIVLALIPKTRLIGLGLILHIAHDWVDCAIQ